MRKSKFRPEQIVQALRQAEAGTVGGDICPKLDITDATFFRGKKTCVGLDLGEVRELCQMREENRRLKGVVADLTRNKTILREARGKDGELSAATGDGALGADCVSPASAARLSVAGRRADERALRIVQVGRHRAAAAPARACARAARVQAQTRACAAPPRRARDQPQEESSPRQCGGAPGATAPPPVLAFALCTVTLSAHQGRGLVPLLGPR
ncbi:MAG: transposase [Gemmatimonadaceae bacterium]|nr:transposase [Gemmatimonadaceae bacterium]